MDARLDDRHGGLRRERPARRRSPPTSSAAPCTPPLFDQRPATRQLGALHLPGPRARDFFADWDRAAKDSVAILRSEAGRNPHDRDLSDLIGELATRSEEFRIHWAAHDVRLHTQRRQAVHPPGRGRAQLSFNRLEVTADPGLTIVAYTAEPGSRSAEAFGCSPAGRPRRSRRTTPSDPATTGQAGSRDSHANRSTAMEHRPLGRTGVSVSKFCLGAMMFGAWGNPDHDESIRIIHAALDAGINFIDTADVYGHGESEEIVGKALAGGRRDDVILATKFHSADGRGPQPPGQLAPLDHPGGRGLAAAAGHRLDRPLPGPPPRPRHRHRGDARRAHRPRPPGQGPLHRPLDVPGQPDRRGAVGRARPAPAALRHRAAAVLDPRPRASRPTSCRPARATAWPSCPTARWPAAGCRAAGARTPASRPPREPAGSPSASTSPSPPTSASSTPSRSSPSSPTRPASRSSSSRSPSS